MILRGADDGRGNTNGCIMCRWARAAGVSQGQIDAIGEWRHSIHFDEGKDRAAAGRGITEGRALGGCDDARRHFSDAEVVELVLTTSAFYAPSGACCIPLDVPLEK